MEDSELLKVIAEKIITAEDVSKIDLGINIGTLRWTGWKESQNTLETHAQLVLFNAANTRSHFYVDIPSMNHGSIESGQCVNTASYFGDDGPVSSKRMYPGETKLEDVREWFKEAVMILIDDVLTAHPEILNAPYEEEKDASIEDGI
jgi:hypothetical protein